MRHTVEDLSYSKGTNSERIPYMDGHKGTYLAEAGTPEALAGAWQQHRRSVGLGTGIANLAVNEPNVWKFGRRVVA